ncbi:MFS family permease [Nocardioides luteus]|uniref:MFS transporter n=1 Tax=Nocardioides luteus TaxID=1844 RepID=A0ABQ5T120_9ACTN|nr:MFS transporter [Nocardioides luteus]MDR7312618.1 MFS family permease [Nocardioides luteus]GGR46343.1 MFS transporter [Nocardioides luteus]GLJ68866.1 MFS transporter [Nocardioides luteus]
MTLTSGGNTTGPRTKMGKIVASSFTGSLIEYYDFLLYSTASAVVFNEVFFSNLDPVTGTIASFGTFAAGYLARPLGGVVFGHFGDRLGRKKMLVMTMLIMGVVSFLIGCLPTYGQIGAAAPVLLVLLRVIQGVAVGGEWGGAVLITAEHATSRRGLWASFTNAGAPAGMVLSTAVMAVMASVTTPEQFLAWGWRVPFLLSIVLLAVGLWIRLSVTESPAFEKMKDSKAESRTPLLEVLRNHPRTLLLAVGVGLGAFVVQGTLTTFLISYALGAGFERPTVLNALTVSSAGAVIGILGWSALTDRVGRRPVVLSAAIATAVFAYLLFPMLDSGSVALLFLAVILGQSVIHAAFYGPLAALMSEVFKTSSRYTGASLGYQLAGMGAGFSPLLFASLQKAGAGTVMLSTVIAAFCLLSVFSLLRLGETSSRELVDAS